MHFTRNNSVNTLFSNPSHNPRISGLKNGPGSRHPYCNPYLYL